MSGRMSSDSLAEWYANQWLGVMRLPSGYSRNSHDISNLLELYLKIEENLVSKSICRCGVILLKRNIIDAIVLIYHRGKEDCDIGSS